MSFEVDGKVVASLSDDPWQVCRRGKIIKPFTSWWFPGDNSKDRSQNACNIVGYVDAYPYADGSSGAGYILENSDYYYMMEPKGVWALLLVKDKPQPEVLSDDEDVTRDGVDDEHHPRGGAARRPRARTDMPVNAPRLGDEYAEEILQVVNELHGSKDDIEEEINEETGEVKTKSGRVPTGWEDDTYSDTPQPCTVGSKLKLKKPIPRKYCRCRWLDNDHVSLRRALLRRARQRRLRRVRVGGGRAPRKRSGGRETCMCSDRRRRRVGVCCAAASTPCAGARPALCGSAARALIKDLLVSTSI